MKLYFIIVVLTVIPAFSQSRKGFYERPPTNEQIMASSKVKKPDQKPNLPIPDNKLDTRPFMGIEESKKKEPENLLLNWKKAQK